MKKKYNRKFFGISLIGIMLVTSIIALNIDINNGIENNGSWIKLTSLKASDTTDGTDSIVNIYVYPDTEIADITSSPYECNEGDSLAHGDDVDGFDDGETLTGDVPTGVNYLIAIEVNFSSKAYNTTSSDWDKTLVKAELTSSDLSYTAETMLEATDFSQQDGSTSAHLTFYLNPDDSLTTGQTITVDDVDIYYWA